jgi:hypothetical protein
MPPQFFKGIFELPLIFIVKNKKAERSSSCFFLLIMEQV